MSPLLPLDPFGHMRADRGWPGTPACHDVPHGVAEAVHERDAHACRYCGFRGEADRDVVIHHLDHDHANHAEENLVTACGHCHGAHHAGYWGARGMAKVVLLPEVGQAALSALARAVAVAEHVSAFVGRGEPEELLRGMRGGIPWLRATLESRAKAARDALGSDEPEDLHDALGRLPPGVDTAAKLSPFRIWLTLDDRVPGYDIPKAGRMDVYRWTRQDRPYAWLG